MSIKLRALSQALALLASIQARYAIVYDGNTYGEPFPEPKPEPSAPKRTRRFPKGAHRYLIQPFLDTCTPGAIFEHDFDTHAEAKSVRSTLTADLGHKFGDKSYISSVTKTVAGKYHVEVLYVVNNRAQGDLL